MLTFNIFLIILLIIATAFFVATEFAIVKLRPSRVNQMVMEGRKNALSVQRVTNNLDGYLSACQLGITLTALGLGWLGEPTIERLLHDFIGYYLPEPLLSIVSFAIAFAIITFLHVVVGELAPKTVAIQKAEATSLLTARPIIVFYKIMYPFIWLLNGSAAQLIKLFGLKPAKEHEEAHTEEELHIILTESYRSGKINQSEYGYVNKIFAFDERLAREIMVPRIDMVCLYQDKALVENLNIIKSEQYTRFPVAIENKDHIVGMINTKQFLLDYSDDNNVDFANLIRPILTVSEVTPVKNLLKEMQKHRSHIAILIDEYGGTSGMVTIEDILEEIVGEIRDEFDVDEKAPIEKLSEHHFLVDGKTLLHEINDLLKADIREEELDTVGGWLYNVIPDVNEGAEYEYDNLTFIVRKRDKNRIRKIEIIKNDSQIIED